MSTPIDNRTGEITINVAILVVPIGALIILLLGAAIIIFILLCTAKVRHELYTILHVVSVLLVVKLVQNLY